MARPAWYDELVHGLALHPLLAISGNLRDLFADPQGAPGHFLDFEDALLALLSSMGIEGLLIHDPVDGLRLHGTVSADLRHRIETLGLGPGLGDVARGEDELIALYRAVAEASDPALALVFDYASHLGVRHATHPDRLFMAMDKLSRSIPPRPEGRALPARNPALLLIDQPADLPDWFAADNPMLRDIQIAPPSLEERLSFAATLVSAFVEDEAVAETGAGPHLEQFALECEGDTLRTMLAIARLAGAEGLPLTRISEAVRSYRTGAQRNPWTSPVLRARMRTARERLTHRVKGQDHAIEKTLDILMRSIAGLSGAQTGNRHARPRGALFFAGPTGVGKTELAKAVTELLFGDELACHRFDMSEFMEEGSVTRLLGAPPGQPGHEQGSELINALRRRPFAVFLFDEIEKAHPRILDAFLQILDEGRLTDARGAVAHFSEALIIFTSNIGMFGGAKSMNMGMDILPSDPYRSLERKVIKAVQDHFRFELRRPELMNRLGQNIVAFNFIHHEGERVIFSAIVDRVLAAVRAEHGLEVTFSPAAFEALRELCTRDVFDGGRGIGNRVETHLINPLSREIYLTPGRSHLTVEAVRDEHGRTVLDCR